VPRSSTRQKATNITMDTTTRIAISSQLAAASFPASLRAMSIAPTDTTRQPTPSQSIGPVESALDSGARNITRAVATTATAAIVQKTEWNPNSSARYPPARASTPATPPLTAVTTPIRVP
jgi:hypothetical protein